jgi:hypothetical protein
MTKAIKAVGSFLWNNIFLIGFVFFAACAGYDYARQAWVQFGADIALALTEFVGYILIEAREKLFAKTDVEEIVDQLNERRPLPLGRRDFGEWAHRIITGAMLPVVEGEDAIAFIESQKFALATMIMHLGPTESHKPDAFFIHQLRKSASNQVAHEILQELKKARMAKADAEAKVRALEAAQNAAVEAQPAS